MGDGNFRPPTESTPLDRSPKNLVQVITSAAPTAAPNLKTVKSPYLCNRLTDFYEIWHDDAHRPPTADRPLKFWIFENSRWRQPPSWKLQKNGISPQRFDRSLRNLVRWCKMGLLTVKNFEFHKSKMADGRHFKNRYIILSQQPFDWFLLNLARWCMLVPRAWRKVQIFNFRQFYTADRRYLANRKTV